MTNREYDIFHENAPAALFKKKYPKIVVFVYQGIREHSKPDGISMIAQEQIGKGIVLDTEFITEAIDILVRDGYIIDLEPHKKANQPKLFQITEKLARENEFFRETFCDADLS
jgi:hypothetical protein